MKHDDSENIEITTEILGIIEKLCPTASEEVKTFTPKRVSRMYNELLSGYNDNPEKILGKDFSYGDDSMVVISGTETYSLCEHHLLPFYGVVHIGYIVYRNKIVGLSKIPRLVNCFAHRLQIQERMTTQIADSFVEYVSPDVIVVSDMKHMCYMMRGVQKQGTSTLVSVVRGRFRTSPEARQEFFSLLGPFKR